MTSVTSTCTACGATYRGRLQQCPNCGKQITDLPELRTGDIVDGKYEIVSLLGVGGMGQVFKARHVHLNTFRTVKVMRKILLVDETNRNRFVREARLATLVHHHNVAVVHDFSTLPDGTHYMVSEFIDGMTIRQWAKQHGRLGVPLALRIALQVLSGLENIHRAGLLHRDLSADNIMIASTEDGEPVAKIIDLGIAKQLVGATMSESTQIGLFVGNPRYSSPEQLGALPEGEEIDGRADIYCFGIVLYEMIAGVPPFVANTPHGYAVKHLTEAPPPLTSNPDLAGFPPGLQAVIFKALEKQRAKRYTTAREFGLALAPFATDALSPTTQMKIAALGSRGPSTIGVPHPESEIPPTMTPPPSTEEDEDEAWRMAATARNRDSFQKFLARFPSGVYASAARARLAEMDQFDEVGRMAERGDTSGLQRLLKAHTADSPMARVVKNALDSAVQRRNAAMEEEWQEAVRRAGRESFQRFLRLFPDSSHAAEARARIEEIDVLEDVERFERSGDAERIRTIADANVTNARITAAALTAYNRLADAHRRRMEAEQDERWRTVSRDGSANAFRGFLTTYPDGAHADEARARVEELERLDEIEALARREDLPGLKRLAQQHTDHPRLTAALRATIERLEDTHRQRLAVEQDQAWTRASEDGSRDAYAAFLRQFPEGFHAVEARTRIDEMDLNAEIERMVEHSDLVGLRSLAEAHTGDSPAARRIRGHLERLEQESRRRRALETEQAWAKAVADGSRDAYAAFLRQFPDGYHGAEARARVDEMELNAEIEAMASRADLAGLRSLADAHVGDTPAARKIRGHIERLEQEARRRRAVEQESAWREAERDPTRDAMQRYLRHYPDAVYAPQARARLAELDLLDEIARLESTGDTDGLRRIAEFQPPESQAGVASREALDRLAEATRRRRMAEEEQARLRRMIEEEERDWGIAQQGGTSLGWKAYLSRHGDSSRAPLARRMLDEADEFERAMSANSVQEWRAFINAWPESRFRSAAEQRLHAAEEILASHDYAAAVKADTPEAYHAFITEHPSSPLAAEAKRRWSLGSDLSLARKADTAAVWREVLSRHPDEPLLAEGRNRLHDLEESLRRDFDAALASRSAAGLRSVLQRDRSRFMSELARAGLEEINALQAAIRAGHVEALRRFTRNYASGHFLTSAEYLMAKYEDAAFSGLVQSRSRERAVRFLTDFPGSNKTSNVRRLLATLDDTDAFNRAIRELRRGNLHPSEDAVARINDAHMKNVLLSQVEQYKRSSGTRKFQLFVDYLIGATKEQFGGKSTNEAALEPTGAFAELRAIKDGMLDEIKDLAAVLKPEVDRFLEEQAAPAPAPAPAERPVSPRRTEARSKHIDQRLKALEAAVAPKRGRLLPALVLFLFALVGAGAIYLMADRTRATMLADWGRARYRRIAGIPDPPGWIVVNAAPWGRIQSIRGPGGELITGPTFTPSQIAVPAGSYSVVVVGPDQKEEKTATVSVRSGQSQPVGVAFETLGADEYLTQLR